MKTPRIRVVTSAERELQKELVANEVSASEVAQEKAPGDATFAEWIKEWRRQKRNGARSKAPVS